MLSLLKHHRAQPFLKWAGGKRALLPVLQYYTPQGITRYWEPFLGGGAFFFHLAHRLPHACISDKNHELMVTYQIVKYQVDALIEALHDHERGHRDPDYFYRIRDQEPLTDLATAARCIYLNAACFNGIYRVNQSGKFNTPKGEYQYPHICSPERLRAASQALSKVHILTGDFYSSVFPQPGDFIYCDPPYDQSFTSYQPEGFTWEDQVRLRQSIDMWRDAGALVMVSQHNTDRIRELYHECDSTRPFYIYPIKAPRGIGGRQRAASELLITTYSI